LQDLPSQPRDEPTNSCTTSLSAAASRRGSGGGEASTARCSTPFIMSISILAGAQTALADLSTICVTIAFCNRCRRQPHFWLSLKSTLSGHYKRANVVDCLGAAAGVVGQFDQIDPLPPPVLP